jgi:CO dehydrogenase maturation factor
MPDFDFLGFIHYDEKILEADLSNTSPLESNTELMEEVEKIATKAMESELERDEKK